LPIDDPQRRKPDISLARDILNWQPAVDLDTGLKKTIAYFEALFSER
jgi:UDP-glucuronate decarboxylase